MNKSDAYMSTCLCTYINVYMDAYMDLYDAVKHRTADGEEKRILINDEKADEWGISAISAAYSI